MHGLVGFLRMLMRQSVSAVVKCRGGTATDHKIQKVFEIPVDSWCESASLRIP